METRSLIVPCPYCGVEKRIAYAINNWTKSEYTFWSDSRIESDEWCEPAHTQQCPSCKKFFTLPPTTELRKEDSPCDDTGLLPYQTLKIAIEKMSGHIHAEEWARLEAWWAFNSKYQDIDDIPWEEQVCQRANMQWLADYYSNRNSRFSYLLFELNRLLGNKKECKKMIANLTFEEYLKEREEKNRERGFISTIDEKFARTMYKSKIDDLKFALSQPLRIYRKN